MIVFVAGTGTDVGKTYVTAALVRRANAGAWKPIVSGPSDDPTRIRAVAPPLYVFDPPISPHLAARQAGVELDVGRIAKRALELAAQYTHFFVESAGGLFSPLDDRTTNHDLARALAGAMLLVAPNRIGVLHDIGATVRAAGIKPVIALSDVEHPDPSSATNAAEIQRLGLARAVVPFLRGQSSEQAADQCLNALGISLS
jgi:dethiobiotin synthetase